MATNPVETNKVLVLCATGKAGKGIVQGLVARGFDVFGTTRSAKNGAVLEKLGAKPIVANYVVGADVQRALQESGANQMVFNTDFFGAAKSKMALEEEQGKIIIDAAKASGVAFTVFISACDAEGIAKHRPKSRHFLPKLKIEDHLRASGLAHAILRPVVFFENLDDATSYNPLKPGRINFFTAAPTLFVSTFDLGKAAAACLRDQVAWNGKALNCASWKGDLNETAAAMQAVSGVKCSGSLPMPTFIRWLFLRDLDQMCRYFEAGYPDGAGDGSMLEFKKVVPDALDAQGWFRHHGVYADGTPIVKA
jgi:uncharacterized protein YbjT (DUF2867 family)